MERFISGEVMSIICFPSGSGIEETRTGCTESNTPLLNFSRMDRVRSLSI
jgi:hypothetical protein